MTFPEHGQAKLGRLLTRFSSYYFKYKYLINNI
jgi:hypothetical protein